MRFLAVILALLVAFQAPGATVYVIVHDISSGIVANRTVTMTLTKPTGAAVAGPWIVAGDSVAQRTDATGTSYFSNVLAIGEYRLDVSGNPSRSFPFSVSSTSGVYNVVQLMGTNAATPMFYDSMQVDQILASGSNITNKVSKIGDQMGGTLTNTASFALRDDSAQIATISPAATLGGGGFAFQTTNATSANALVNIATLDVNGLNLKSGVLTATNGATFATVGANALTASNTAVAQYVGQTFNAGGTVINGSGVETLNAASGGINFGSSSQYSINQNGNIFANQLQGGLDANRLGVTNFGWQYSSNALIASGANSYNSNANFFSLEYHGTNSPLKTSGENSIVNGAIGGTNIFAVEAPGQFNSLAVLTNGNVKIGNPSTAATVVNLGLAANGIVTTNASPILPALGAAYPAALTNNDTRTVNFIGNPFTITPTAAYDPLTLGNNAGQGLYGFNNALVLKGDGYLFNNKDNASAFGEMQSTASGHKGDLIWGGPGYGSNYFYAPYTILGTGIQTNRITVSNPTERFYPVPFVAANSYYDMVVNPNDSWATNTIALFATVAPGWKNTGWSNIWYDGGFLTNRVSTHITNNNGTSFHSGVTGIVTYAHSQGFQIGAYIAHSPLLVNSPGIGTSDDLAYQDVYDIGNMGFDFLKLDNCGTGLSYQGQSYDQGDAFFRARHNVIFPAANMWMSARLGRKPLFMLTTENQEFNNFGQIWNLPENALYNGSENAGTGQVGSGTKWQGTLTNFVVEMPNFIYTRPGHFPRFIACTGTTAADGRGNVALHVLAPAIMFLGGTNFVGNATVSPFYTNGFVNVTLLQNPLVQPGWMVSSNASTGISVISRPLGPYNNRTTTANQFTKPSKWTSDTQAGQTQLTGYNTYGTDGTNLVGVFNLDTGGAHTAVISVTNIGCASNSPVEVFDVWNGGSLGVFIDAWTSPSISASDSGLYVFAPVISFRTNFIGGQLYTNNYGKTITVSATISNVVANTAGASRHALWAYQQPGLAGILGNTNFYGDYHQAMGATVVWTNLGILSIDVPNTYVWAFTNQSSGAGNDSRVMQGTITFNPTTQQ